MITDDEIRSTVNTPAEIGTKGVEYIEEIEAQKHRAMPLPIPQIGGSYFADLMPGQICGILAQTSNYKTGFMEMWETYLAGYLRDRGRKDEIIIRVDTENTIEGLAIQKIARLSGESVADLSRGNVHDWSKVIKAAASIAGIDVYHIADSLGEADAPELYLTNIYRAIKFMMDGKLVDRKLKPACIFVDYLQALPFDEEVSKYQKLDDKRRLQVRRDVYRLKQMANHFNCPVVVGLQAKQTLGGNSGPNMMIPGVYDAEETSSIAQRFTRLISLWMPKMTHVVGDQLKHGDLSFTVDENLIFIKVLKQQGGLPSGKTWMCDIDYDTNTIKPRNRYAPKARDYHPEEKPKIKF